VVVTFVDDGCLLKTDALVWKTQADACASTTVIAGGTIRAMP